MTLDVGALPAIVAPPNRPGEALVQTANVAVWQVIFELQQHDGNRTAVAVELGITDDEMEAALAYYRLHHAELDAAILANSRSFDP